VAVPVGVEINGICAAGQICDLSVTGARIEKTDISPLIGSRVQVSFVLGSDAAPLEVSAEVVRETRGGGFAIEFREEVPQIDDVLSALLEQAQQTAAVVDQVKETRIEELMRHDVASLTVDDSIETAQETLERASPRCIVICEKEEPIGMVTDQELIEARGREALVTLREIMRSPVIVVSAEERLSRVLGDPHRLTVRYLPVVSEDGRLCGLLSQVDLLFHCANVLLGRS